MRSDGASLRFAEVPECDALEQKQSYTPDVKQHVKPSFCFHAVIFLLLAEFYICEYTPHQKMSHNVGAVG
jgi:hypothetical protein